MIHKPRVLRARDIERLENTSFASLSLGAAPNVEATAHVDQASGLTCALPTIIQVSNGGGSCIDCSITPNCSRDSCGGDSCTGGASCTGGDSCTGGASCTGTCNLDAAQGDNAVAPVQVPLGTVAAARPFGWLI